jgi:hypothetical protein
VSAPTMVDAPSTPELVTLWQIANAMAASGKYEAAFTPEEAFARILAGRDLGLSPSDAMLHMNWIDGQFQPSAEIQGALLKAYVGADGERFDYRAIREDTQCLVTILRRDQGQPWEEIGDVTFTMEDARRAELHDSSEFWRKYPRRMLFWRALTEAIEAFAPQVVHPVQLPAAVSIDDDLVIDAPDLPVPAGNPAELQRGEDAHPDDAPGWLPLFERIVRSHEKRGMTGRIVEVLDAVGAPQGENLLHRFAQLPDGNKAHEVCYRLDRHRLRRRRQGKDPETTGQQGGHDDTTTTD